MITSFMAGAGGKPLPGVALNKALAAAGGGEATVHGFRCTFRDWCAEATNTPRELAEAALAHTLSDKVEAAYRRGDMFEKRRALMAQWAALCGKPYELLTGKVVAIDAA